MSNKRWLIGVIVAISIFFFLGFYLLLRVQRKSSLNTEGLRNAVYADFFGGEKALGIYSKQDSGYYSTIEVIGVLDNVYQDNGNNIIELTTTNNEGDYIKLIVDLGTSEYIISDVENTKTSERSFEIKNTAYGSGVVAEKYKNNVGKTISVELITKLSLTDDETCNETCLQRINFIHKYSKENSNLIYNPGPDTPQVGAVYSISLGNQI